MHQMSIDIETFSEVNLKTCGVYKYTEHPSFDILLAAVSTNRNEPICYDLTMPAQRDEFLAFIAPTIMSEQWIKKAANAEFEWVCLSVWLARQGFSTGMLPINQWRDTFLLGLYCGLPAKLEKLGEAVNLSSDKKKMAIGGSLIRKFCVPRKPTKKDFRTRVMPKDDPQNWDLFKTYCIGDVVAEMAVEDALQPITVPDHIQREWELQILQNARGICVDAELVDGAICMTDHNSSELLKEAAEITGVDNPNSRDQLFKWLTSVLGDNELPDLTKNTVANLLKLEPGADITRVLEIRQETGKAALKKYPAIVNVMNADGRIRGQFQYYGAFRTGRWSGKLAQPQNLAKTHLWNLTLARELVKNKDPRPLRAVYGNVSDALGQLVRTSLIPSEGYSFVDADFSAIEARVIAWLAGEEWVLDVFRTHGKIYETNASRMFDIPFERIKKGNPEYSYRDQGKMSTLALGFAGGVNALDNMCKSYGVHIPDSDKPGLVKAWRKANPKIVKLWYDLESAAIRALQCGTPQRVGYITYEYKQAQNIDFILCHLPSGRHLSYPSPKLVPGKFDKPQLSYLSYAKQKIVRDTTYSGKLAENVTQAVARDILAQKITALHNAGESVVFSVHDEVVLEQPKGQEDLQRICDILSTPLPWCEDLPLNAAGWVGDYYTKD